MLYVIVVVIAGVVIVASGWLVWQHRQASATPRGYGEIQAIQRQITGYESVTVPFMDDLEENHPTDAWTLTSPYFRSDPNVTETRLADVFSLLHQYIEGAAFRVVNLDGSTYKGKTIAAVEYEFTSGQPIYVVLLAEHNPSAWQIADFKYISAELNPIASIVEFNE